MEQNVLLRCALRDEVELFVGYWVPSDHNSFIFPQSPSGRPSSDAVEALLEVEGANGQSVPYLGYVELTLTFPKDFLGVEAEIDTLALVVPDLVGVQQILIGNQLP